VSIGPLARTQRPNAKQQEQLQKQVEVLEKQVEVLQKMIRLLVDRVDKQAPARVEQQVATLEARSEQAARRDQELAYAVDDLREQADVDRRWGPDLPWTLKQLFDPFENNETPLSIYGSLAFGYSKIIGNAATAANGAGRPSTPGGFYFGEFTPDFFLLAAGPGCRARAATAPGPAPRPGARPPAPPTGGGRPGPGRVVGRRRSRRPSPLGQHEVHGPAPADMRPRRAQVPEDPRGAKVHLGRGHRADGRARRHERGVPGHATATGRGRDRELVNGTPVGRPGRIASRLAPPCEGKRTPA
jgi:hypothetical protein